MTPESRNSSQVSQSTVYRLKKLQIIQVNVTIIVTTESVETTKNVWGITHSLNKKQEGLRSRGTSTENDLYWKETRRWKESFDFLM
jgi:hypothetical protein